jgi:GR25 family glycosyltransferase involved in LPS biosynthesis
MSNKYKINIGYLQMNIDCIFYINLDHRTDRKCEIEGELNSMGLPYERFAAIRHETIGGVGCGRSHVGVLKLAKERGYKRIMVLEDDFMFTSNPHDALSKLDDVSFDVCLLSYNLFQSSESTEYPFLHRVHEAQTTSGYIINAHYYDALIAVFEDAIPKFEQTNHHWLYAIDVAWKVLQRRDTWYCFSPRIGKQRPSYSDCGNCYSEVDW